jgi:hypothetical protein
MTTVEIKTDARFDIRDILSGVSKLETSELENFLQEVAHILARRKTRLLSHRETELLSQIGDSLLPDNLQKRYNLLYQSLQMENISDIELAELQNLSKQLEKNAVKRLRSMVELSHLRKVTLEEIMEQLGIKHYQTNA